MVEYGTNPVFIEGLRYRLRAGAPLNRDPRPLTDDFVIHTFMAECIRVEMFQYTNHLDSSSDFRAQGGELISAQYKRLEVSTGNAFSGQRVYSPDYIDEALVTTCGAKGGSL